NHPLNQVAHKLAPAIAAGTPIVLKPSEKTPLAALWLGDAIHEAGYPREALAIVTGDREEILDEMLQHEAVEVVSFTGAVSGGKGIAAGGGARCAGLEVGGNDRLLVLRDADIERPAELGVRGARKNGGNRFTAVKRVIVEDPLADELAEAITVRAEELRVGDP